MINPVSSIEFGGTTWYLHNVSPSTIGSPVSKAQPLGLVSLLIIMVGIADGLGFGIL